MNRLIQITMVLQAVGISIFFVWLIMRPTGVDPSQPFLELQAFTDRYGPQKAVNALGATLFTQAANLCRREACIQARYGGNRGRWLTVTAAKQRDPCSSFQPPSRCGRTMISHELKKVVGRVNRCSVVGRLKRGSKVRLRVDCDGVQDFVTVERRGPDGWAIVGDERYPGFLPRVHSANFNRPK